MTLDALDSAKVGDLARDVVIDSFWDWYDNTPEQPSATAEEDRRSFEAHTQWLRELNDRDLGERLVHVIERAGFKVVKSNG